MGKKKYPTAEEIGKMTDEERKKLGESLGEEQLSDDQDDLIARAKKQEAQQLEAKIAAAKEKLEDNSNEFVVKAGLQSIQGEYSEANKSYLRAIESCPDNEIAKDSYAKFLEMYPQFKVEN